MRRAGALAIVVAAVVLGLGASELLAQSRGAANVPAMAARPDAAQLQAVAWEWARTTVASTPFLVGLGAGIVLAEAGRFLLRWLLRTAAFLNGTLHLVLRYRLAVAGVAGLLGYAITQWGPSG